MQHARRLSVVPNEPGRGRTQSGEVAIETHQQSGTILRPNRLHPPPKPVRTSQAPSLVEVAAAGTSAEPQPTPVSSPTPELARVSPDPPEWLRRSGAEDVLASLLRFVLDVAAFLSSLTRARLSVHLPH